jgi:hypothetical protein
MVNLERNMAVLIATVSQWQNVQHCFQETQNAATLKRLKLRCGNTFRMSCTPFGDSIKAAKKYIIFTIKSII